TSFLSVAEVIVPGGGRCPDTGGSRTPASGTHLGEEALRRGLTGGRVQDQPLGVGCGPAGEAEQAVERAGQAVEAAGDPWQPPVVLDEPDDRGLVGEGVVDRVALRPRGDEDQRQPGAVAATAGLTAEHPAGPALTGAGQGVG